MTRFRLPILVFLGFAFLLVLLLSNGLAAFLIDWMWLSHLGYSGILLRTIFARAVLGLIGWGVACVFIFANAQRALGTSSGISLVLPSELARTPAGKVLGRVRIRGVVFAASLLISLFVGLGASSRWETILPGIHGSAFDYTDPIFGRDAAFYVFTLPILQFLLGFAWTVGIISALLAIVIYSVSGGILYGESAGRGRAGPNLLQVGTGPRNHLSLMAGYFLVLLAFEFYIRRFTLLYWQHGLMAGPGYSTAHGTLPMLNLQAFTAIAGAALVVYGVRQRAVRYLSAAAGLVIGASLLASIYPTAIQKFRVEPNEMKREAPYLGYHLEATRTAFGLGRVTVRSLSGNARLSRADLEANRTTLRSIRLWDSEPLLATLKQIQEIGQYYEFGSVDNDRYKLGGELRQLMISPRELLVSQLPEKAATWVNETLTYTHGYGATIAPVNEVTSNGLPELYVKDLPPKSAYPELEIKRPELYYGEFMNNPVIAPSKSDEFDYPAGNQVKTTRYEGHGGVAVGGIFRRILLAMRLGSLKPLLSADFSASSRALLYRSISDRVHRIVPFLTLDSDPYLVVHKGRLIWMMDAYTQSSRFPYSQQVRGLGNYLRNSVKITIDAYDGDVQFYISDPDDPIIRAWAGAFPGVFQPLDQMDPDLRAHLRYPSEYFALQARMFQTYHVEKSEDFYKREGEWIVPSIEGTRMDPYFTVMKLPGESSEEFILMLPFTPLNRPNLAAWMVARNDGDHYGDLVVYKFPQGSFVKGPAQITGQINQDVKISEKLTLWNQRGSQATLGTLLVIPIEESLIYVQPLYLRAESGSIPELERVIVSYEDQIAMAPTLEEALREIFPEEGSPQSGPSSGEDSERIPNATGAGQAQSGAESDAGEAGHWAAEAQQHYDAAQQSARDGDWAKYGEEQKALGEAIRNMRESLPTR